MVSETLPALQRLKEAGLVRHIGITGLPFSIFHYVLDRVPPGESACSKACLLCVDSPSLYVSDLLSLGGQEWWTWSCRIATTA